MPKNKVRLFPLDLPVALFLISAALALLPAYDVRTAYLPLAVLLAGGVLYGLVSRLGANSSGAMRIAMIGSGVGALVSVYFITQYPHYPGLDKVALISQILALIGRVSPNLAFWTPVANSVATLLEGLIFLALGAGLATRGRGARWFLLGCAGLMAAAVLLSSSRGAWLAVGLAGLVWLSLYFRPARWLGYALLAGLLVLIAVVLIRQDILILERIPVVNRTIAPLFIRPDRLDVYRGSLQLIRDVPLTGIGLGGQFAMNYSRYVLMIQVPYLEYSHNLYLEVWLQQGLLGLAAWIWMLATLYFGVTRAQSGGHNPLLEGGWIGLTATLLHGITDARQYSDGWTWLAFFLLLGICAAELSRAGVGFAGRREWIPLGVTVVILLGVSVMLPSLPAAWRANIGSLQQAEAALSPTIGDEERAALREMAEQNFVRAIALTPEERTPNLRLGLMLTEDEHFAQALPYLVTAATHAPGNRTAAKALGLAYVWNGEIARAAQMLALLPEMVQELNTWAAWRVSRGQTQLARYALQTSLQIAPDQPEVRNALDHLAQ